MKLDDAAFQKWQEWMALVEKDLTELVNNQQIFYSFLDVVKDSSDHIHSLDQGIFVGFISDCYVAQAISGIRRHLKYRDDGVSLTKVIHQVQMCADQFTFSFYLKQFPRDESDVDWQTPTFRQFSDDGVTVSSRITDAHLTKVKTLNQEIERLADKTVAHLGKEGFQGKVTFGDLKESINTFNRLACEYLSLISSKGFDTLEPTIIPNWTEVFRHPFVKNTHGES